MKDKTIKVSSIAQDTDVEIEVLSWATILTVNRINLFVGRELDEDERECLKYNYTVHGLAYDWNASNPIKFSARTLKGLASKIAKCQYKLAKEK